MSKGRKKTRGAGGIWSNIDRETTDSQEASIERDERRDEHINRKIKSAEAAEVEQGHQAASTIFSWQEQGNFTYDSKRENDINVLKNKDGSWRTSLPVLERQIDPDGTYNIVLYAIARKAIEYKIYCANCEERQPEDKIQHRRMVTELGRKGWKLPPVDLGDMCAYCRSPLGLSGARVSSGGPITPEQRGLLGME